MQTENVECSVVECKCVNMLSNDFLWLVHRIDDVIPKLLTVHFHIFVCSRMSEDNTLVVVRSWSVKMATVRHA